MNRVFFRAVVRTIAPLALAVFLGGEATAETLVRFQLDWRFEGNQALVLHPAHKGYFKQEGLDVQIDVGAGSGLAVNRIASGRYDMGIADINSLVEFLGNNQHNPAARIQAVFMLFDELPAAIFTLKKNGIRKPADLQGKVIGSTEFESSRRAYPLFERANNLDRAAVRWKTMDGTLKESMLLKGDVDAITGFSLTTFFNLSGRGIKDEDIVMLRFRDHGVRLYGNAIIASKKFIDENPKAVAAFLRALTRGIREVVADPEQAVLAVKARDPLIDTALEVRRLRMTLDEVVGTPGVRANGIGAIERARFQDTLQKVVATFNIKSTPDVDSVFNASFLPSQAERMVFPK